MQCLLGPYSSQAETEVSPQIILCRLYTHDNDIGIGLAIIQGLSQRLPTDQIILAARSEASITPALSSLTTQGFNTSTIDSIILDVTNDESILEAVGSVKEKYGKLDVLVNNAAVALVPKPDEPLSVTRGTWTQMMDTNVASVANVTNAFLPLLKSSTDPKVINISSARASIQLNLDPSFPATISAGYSVSKAALNMLTVDMQKLNTDVRFYAASPGHCKTALNGFRGARDPAEGGRVVIELVEGDYRWGFWKADGAEGPCEEVPW